MKFICQQSAINSLNKLASSSRHSVLIEGIEGTGKTYLAKNYSEMLNVSDFVSIAPTVSAIRDTLDQVSVLNTPVVICIENLDIGVSGSSYTLLKFLEEPTDNVYMIVTCRNVYQIPDTILSRSTTVSISPPTASDLKLYATNKYPSQYLNVADTITWKCVKSFADIDVIMKLSLDQLNYLETLTLSQFNDSVSNIVWKLGHFPDNSETPIKFVITRILQSTNNSHIQRCGIDCLNDLASNRIAQHAVLSKFCMDVKYTE